MIHQSSITVSTSGRGTYDVNEQISRVVAESGVQTGLCHLFIRHTSASIILCENADPDVQRDLAVFMERLVPDGDPIYHHVLEGPDDMAAHVRTVLTQSDMSIPITAGRMGLGTWQGLYLWEHRTASHRRMITITVSGE